MDDIRAQVHEVFRQAFGDPELVLRDDMAIAKLPGWDSMTHISLMVAAERRFKIKIAAAEMSGLKGAGGDIGAFVALIGRKAARAS
jgi:acyl carrier protein